MRGTLRFDPTLSILGGNNGLLDQTAIDVVIDLQRSVSSKAPTVGATFKASAHTRTRADDSIPLTLYTPCLTWPQCGYPAQDCSLKHPQVDKLTSTRRTQPHTALSTTTISPQARSGAAPRAETYPDASLVLQHYSQLRFRTPALFTPAGGYASVKLHHRPTAPSAEMFTPAPVRPLVRLCRPSEDMRQDQATGMQCGLGMGAYQGRARSAGIAVQRLGAKFSKPVLQTQARVFARRQGKGMHNLADLLDCY
jgi:hypothetical protein